MQIKDIFFDLDRTLWDFEKNSQLTLIEIINQLELIKRGVDSAESFIKKYRIHNDRLWILYRENKITKDELRSKRFLLTLEEYQIYDIKLADRFGQEYVDRSPLKTKLFPFAKDVLSYLHEKYKLHIITNGFQEVQHIKLKRSDISQYFNIVLTSEEVGAKKPESKIFNYALQQANTLAKNTIMIGDDLHVDIKGAELSGIRGIYFNPKSIKHSEDIWQEIRCLSELKTLL